MTFPTFIYFLIGSVGFYRVSVIYNDGFKLAEKDLSIRGPGEIYGLRQHGILDLKMASLTDVGLIKEAQQEAEKILKSDSELKNHQMLISELNNFKISRHLE